MFTLVSDDRNYIVLKSYSCSFVYIYKYIWSSVLFDSYILPIYLLGFSLYILPIIYMLNKINFQMLRLHYFVVFTLNRRVYFTDFYICFIYFIFKNPVTCNWLLPVTRDLLLFICAVRIVTMSNDGTSYFNSVSSW